MTVMLNVLLVALGGAAGSVARYLTGVIALRIAGPGFPWATLFVNITGSFAIGLLAELFARRFASSPEIRLLLITGILGGFTTFSAFSLDAAVLHGRGEMLAFALYIAASVGLSMVAVFSGLALGRSLF